jgi:hypothetical protein
MGIVGQYPESGIRVEVERTDAGGPPWTYRGEAVSPSQRFPLAAEVTVNRDVLVALPDAAPAGMAERIRLLLRAACRTGTDATPPPRRIVRWRADR